MSQPDSAPGDAATRVQPIHGLPVKSAHSIPVIRLPTDLEIKAQAAFGGTGTEGAAVMFMALFSRVGG